MVDAFTAALFVGRRGERFRIHLDDATSFEAELVEVTALGEPRTEGARAPFSLVFRAPAGDLVPQRIYRVEHGELGSFEIFLVPIGPDEVGMRYEAVFA